MSIDSRAKQYAKVFGDWSIGEEIGKGTEGEKSVVFRLSRKNFKLEEICAMKVVNIIEKNGSYDQMSEEYRQSYDENSRRLCEKAQSEVKLMHDLQNHPNIVRYLDYRFEDWQDGQFFGVDMLIRMDLLDNLGNHLQKGVIFQEETIIQLGIDICKALTICHKMNILHRDIKPDNIFISRSGTYMLGDFGISKMVEDSQNSMTMAGTRAYAAPEQFGNTYDWRIDIYSLGLTLYELANHNRLPFAKTNYVSAEEIAMRLSGMKPEPPCAVSKELADVIMKACEANPEDRYQSAEAFMADLENLHKKAPAFDYTMHMKAADTSQDVKRNRDLYATMAAEASFGIGTVKRHDIFAFGGTLKSEKKDEAVFCKLIEEADTADKSLKLGVMYHFGLGCVQSYYYAFQLFQKAKKMNEESGEDVVATLWLSEYYRMGYVEKQDVSYAERLFYGIREAAEKMCEYGNSEVQFIYGLLLYYGIYTERDTKNGMKWLENAAKASHRMAQVWKNKIEET